MLRIRFINGPVVEYPTADYLETSDESWDIYETSPNGGPRKWIASVSLACHCVVENVPEEEEAEKERTKIPFVQ